jgi:hypothetical protein
VDVSQLQVRAEALARAIAKAEGFGIAGALPTRTNNPGDMELGDRGWGTEAAKTVYAKASWDSAFTDKTDGCSALWRECFAILSGSSHNFEPTMTFLQLAQEWTGNDNTSAWAAIVCQELGTTAEMTLETFAISQV